MELRDCVAGSGVVVRDGRVGCNEAVVGRLLRRGSGRPSDERPLVLALPVVLLVATVASIRSIRCNGLI